MAKKKQKIDKSKIMSRILAGVLAGLMILGVAVTMIYWIIAGIK